MIHGNSVQRKTGQVVGSEQFRRSASAVAKAEGKYSSA
jgi:hypothetical protein